MATGRSFAEFVKDKCYNGLYQTAEEYVNENWESMNLYTRNVHRVGYAMPKVRAVADTIGITVSGIKDGLSGKEPKAIRLLKEQKTNNSTSSVYPSPCQNKVPRSNEEINEIINLMHSSAFTLVACVRLLNNTAIADDGCNPNTRLDIQRNLQMLTAADITAQIELLLDKKNRSLLDESSLSLLESFRDGYFVSADKRIPISHFLD